MTRGRRGGVATAVVVALLLCGCTASTGSKAGAAGVPLILDLATVEQEYNTPYAEDVRSFEQLVNELSDGALQVRIEWQRPGVRPNAESWLADEVRADRIDLALIPARAFSVFGVDRLNALQTPFLIDSPELAAEIAQSDLAATMLADLAPDGFIGLAMMYESMRRPIGLGEPLVALEDYVGVGIRTPESVVATRMFEAFGARPGFGSGYIMDADGNPLSAAESAFAWRAALPPSTVATADVAYYPKYNVIVGSPSTWGDLSSEQRALLRKAAAEVAAGAARGVDDEESEAAAYCLAGHRLVLAGTDTVKSLVLAAAPVRQWLEEDPGTASDIDAIEQIALSMTPPAFTVPRECEPPTGDWAPWPSQGG